MGEFDGAQNIPEKGKVGMNSFNMIGRSENGFMGLVHLMDHAEVVTAEKD